MNCRGILVRGGGRLDLALRILSGWDRIPRKEKNSRSDWEQDG